MPESPVAENFGPLSAAEAAALAGRRSAVPYSDRVGAMLNQLTDAELKELSGVIEKTSKPREPREHTLSKTQQRRVLALRAARSALIGGAFSVSIGQTLGMAAGQKCPADELIWVASYVENGSSFGWGEDPDPDAED